MLRPRLRFGIFMAPFHPVTENPTLCLERDRELVEWLDELGFDEAWIGEHHSAGYEIIASPELFIADLAARTKHIRLGTGVVSLPYHSPLMVAERMNQLDHLTRGRAMFGVGPGLLPSDAMMLGIDPRRQRDMMSEALNVIIPLLRGEVVTARTDWFDLRDAKLQLTPYSPPHIEMAVAASVSPSGPRTAGRWGMGMLSPAATSTGGFSALAHHWGICEESAREHGQSVDRSRWRVAGPVHIAETVGTPDDLIRQIERLEEQSGGFGAFLVTAHEWANRAATRRSYELIARYVMPRFQDTNAYRQRSMEWVQDNRAPFLGAAAQGMLEAIQKDREQRERAEATAAGARRAERG
jgi:limonene 1,2-monooxygenase